MDKSYLYGASPRDLEGLYSTYRVIMTHGLFYELLTGNSEESINCWNHIPTRYNPLELCKPVGELLTYEIDNSKPAPIEAFFLKIPYKFNARLKKPEFDLHIKQRKSLEDWTKQVSQQMGDFLESAQAVNGFFPNLFGTSGEKLNGSAVEAAKTDVASNISSVRRVFSMIRMMKIGPFFEGRKSGCYIH